MYTGLLLGCLKEIGRFEDLASDGKIIFKWVLKMETKVVDWICVVQDEEKCREGGL